MKKLYKILLVDDEEDIVEILQLVFERAGYSVTVARDGQEALEMARAKIPDLVILDVMMPKMHGFRVCQEIRSDATLEKTKILFVTAKAFHSDREMATRLGADAYLEKPFQVHQIMDVVGKLLPEKEEFVL